MVVCIFAGEGGNPEYLFQFVQPDHAVNQPGPVLAMHDPLVGIGGAGDVTHERLQDVTLRHEPLEIAVFVDD